MEAGTISAFISARAPLLPSDELEVVYDLLVKIVTNIMNKEEVKFRRINPKPNKLTSEAQVSFFADFLNLIGFQYSNETPKRLVYDLEGFENLLMAQEALQNTDTSFLEFNPYQSQSTSLNETAQSGSGNRMKEDQIAHFKQKEQSLLIENLEKLQLDRGLMISSPYFKKKPMPDKFPQEYIDKAPSDAQILGKRVKKLQEDAKKKQGFTTSASRELDRLLEKTVYLETNIRIKFDDSTIVMVKFSPLETIQHIEDFLFTEVLDVEYLKSLSPDPIKLKWLKRPKNVTAKEMTQTLKENGFSNAVLLQVRFDGIKPDFRRILRPTVMKRVNTGTLSPAKQRQLGAKGNVASSYSSQMDLPQKPKAKPKWLKL